MVKNLQVDSKTLRDIYTKGKQDGLKISKDKPKPNIPWPGYPNPIPPGKDFPKDWPIPKNISHRSHDPSFTHDGIPRYGWGDDSHDPNQHRIPVDDYNNPIPSLKPTDLQIDKENNRYIDPSLYDEAGMLLSELNPEQLKILKTIPSDLNKRKPEERLKIMRDIHGKVMEKA